MLSDPTRKIVNDLYELAGKNSWFGRAGKDDEICSLLFKLAHSSEPGALPYVVHFLFSSSINVRTAAQTVVASLLSHVSPFDLFQVIDLSLGEWHGYWTQWRELSPNEVRGLATNDRNELQPAVLGLASFHRNGFVRHEAVRLLATNEDGAELPFLLIRQNDWVHPIAADAQAAIDRRITDAYLPHLVNSLRLILHLKKFSRHDHSTIVRRTVALLLRKEHDDILRAAVESPIREVRREVVRLGLESDDENRISLVRYGLNSNDPLVRLACSRCLPQFFEADALSAELSKLVNDSFMPIRREALRSQAEHFPAHAISVWRQALLDAHRSIRELARYSLSKLGEEDHADFYRRVISEQPNSLAAVDGLAETGDTSDITFFRQLLKHELPSRRCVSIRGLSHVAGEAAIPELLDLLRDESRSVVREAGKELTPNLYLVGGERLLAVALEAPTLFARQTAVMLIAAMGKWSSIPWLIKATSEAKGEAARHAEQLIEEWFYPPKCNRVFTRPSENQRQSIEEALSTGQLSERVVDILKREIA